MKYVLLLSVAVEYRQPRTTDKTPKVQISYPTKFRHYFKNKFMPEIFYSTGTELRQRGKLTFSDPMLYRHDTRRTNRTTTRKESDEQQKVLGKPL